MQLIEKIKISIATAVLITSLIVPTVTLAADGQTVFKQTCAMCHQWGVAGAPKFADKKAWAPRIAKGKETLYKHAIHGFKGKSMMPAKGGKASLSDDEVKAAVDYMVKAAK